MDKIEQKIQELGLTAPRVTPKDIEDSIRSVYYFTALDGVDGTDESPKEEDETSLGLLTFCVIVAQNGFTFVGKSACASPENFNAGVGQSIAFEDARDQMWAPLGYTLKQKLFEQGKL